MFLIHTGGGGWDGLVALDDSGFEPRPGGKRFYVLYTGPGPPPGVEGRRRGAHHPSQSSVEVKNGWRYSSAYPLCFHGMLWGDLYLYKLRNSFLRVFLQPPVTILLSIQTNVNNCK
jgi:hypothetical protein